MGQTYSAPHPESTAGVLSSYSNYLPGLVNNTASTLPNLAQNQFNATMATQPLYNALNLQQLQQYGLPTAQAGQDIQRSNALAGAGTNFLQMMGPGGMAARAASGLTNELNPALAAANGKSTELLNAINLNGLSPGEAAATERSNNQQLSGTGNLGLNNNTNTIANAMNFGGAFNNKLGIASNAIGTATNAANAMTGAVNPVNVALGQPGMGTGSNFGTGTFTNTNAGTQNAGTGTAFGFGGNTLGTMGGMNNAATSGAYSLAGANSVPAYMGALPSYS